MLRTIVNWLKGEDESKQRQEILDIATKTAHDLFPLDSRIEYDSFTSSGELVRQVGIVLNILVHDDFRVIWVVRTLEGEQYVTPSLNPKRLG